MLYSLPSDLKCLIRCVHDPSSWTQTIVSTKPIILIHTLSVHTVGIGRLLGGLGLVLLLNLGSKERHYLKVARRPTHPPLAFWVKVAA